MLPTDQGRRDLGPPGPAIVPAHAWPRQVLGKALKAAGVPREDIVLATKVGRYGADTFDFRCAWGTPPLCGMLRCGSDATGAIGFGGGSHGLLGKCMLLR